jgi:integrase
MGEAVPIDLTGFTKVQPGLKWNKRSKTAFFEIWSSSRSPDRSSAEVGGISQRRRYRKIMQFASVEDAIQTFAAFRKQVKSGVTSPAITPASMLMTFREYVETYGSSIWGEAAARTRTMNRYCTKIYLLPFFGTMPLQTILEFHVKDFRVACRNRFKDGQASPLAPATINHALRRLREVLNNARSRKFIAEVPRITLMAEEELRNELTDVEEKALLAAFDDFDRFKEFMAARHKKCGAPALPRPDGTERKIGLFVCDDDAATAYFRRFSRAKALIFAALQTGLRKGDLLNLRWESVRFDERLVIVKMRKTGKAATIPMAASLAALFADLKSQQSLNDSRHVFLTEQGKPYAEVMFRRYFKIAKAIAGITRRFRPHDLRHTFASDLASAGFSTLVLRDLLGHKTTEQSERYARPNPLVAEAVRDALDSRGRQADATLEGSILDPKP